MAIPSAVFQELQKLAYGDGRTACDLGQLQSVALTRIDGQSITGVSRALAKNVTRRCETNGERAQALHLREGSIVDVARATAGWLK